MASQRVKLIVYVPVSHADAVRYALGEAGSGVIGEYSFCSFTTKGVGRFLPSAHAKPAIGSAGILEEVEEESIEVVMPRYVVKDVIQKMCAAHPYEEAAYEVIALEDF